MGQIGVFVQPSTTRLNDKMLTIPQCIRVMSDKSSHMQPSREPVCLPSTDNGKRKCIEVIRSANNRY